MNSIELFFPPFYEKYIKNASRHQDIVEGLSQQEEELVTFFKQIPKDKIEFRYAPDKWTPKDILLHLTDTERIFSYRSLRVARNDKTVLPGFEENDFVQFANANDRSMESLLKEFQTVRKATISLFENFKEEQLNRRGEVSGNQMSVGAMGYVILGHETHHISIIKERYL